MCVYIIYQLINLAQFKIYNQKLTLSKEKKHKNNLPFIKIDIIIKNLSTIKINNGKNHWGQLSLNNLSGAFIINKIDKLVCKIIF